MARQPATVPLVTKRLMGSKARNHKKSKLMSPAPTLEATAEEKVRIVKRRIEKAERDERMDITMALTPVKTYMGGFTRPKDLRALYWSKGGRFQRLGKVFEAPPEAAYEPHTVFLLEGRYETRHGLGRPETFDHVVGFCRESDFPDVLKKYNSPRAPTSELESMDNARWPWGKQRNTTRISWWAKGEDAEAIRREIMTGELASEPADSAARHASSAIPPTVPRSPMQPQARAFHTSARAFDTNSYNADHIVPDFYIQHKKQKKATNSNGEEVAVEEAEEVPVEYHLEDQNTQVRDPSLRNTGIRKRSHKGAALMPHLSDSLMSDEISASTRRLRGKIPVEHYDADGNLVHSSGYVTPGSQGHSSHSRAHRRKENLRDEEEEHAAQTAAVAEAVLESDLDTLSAVRTRPHPHKVPFEVRDAEGQVFHPSGFAPPTPADEFKYSDSASLERDLSSAVSRQRARERDASTPKGGRGIHTTAIARATVAFHHPLPMAPPEAPKAIQAEAESEAESHHAAVMDPTAPRRSLPLSPEVKAVRDAYMPTLAEKPFFRPLLTLSVSTRPLAATLVRLSRSLERGLPFYASIPPEDRRSGPSFNARVRHLRLDRMQTLAVQLAQLLAGARGGLTGLRFSPADTARGVDGHGFDDTLPWDKRVIGVGVGNWQTRAPEIKQSFRAAAAEDVQAAYTSSSAPADKGALSVYGLDEHGRRICDETGAEMPYAAKPSPSPIMRAIADEMRARKEDKRLDWAEDHGDLTAGEVNRLRHERRVRRETVAREHPDALARFLAKGPNSIVHP
ncbi:hypothetical protein CONPUDRAFT_157032 [Coniophora puteana RWD-64-598 SS2]|uniref:Uncharacterized protein n=1 Tax=Coniophora puteana (strain RWD-64-598) TaxID=741705 RepID=A0A5M3MGG9_CONPW|nr:uncharacterized protein CONPUDRAFT_157032 [Coniophora puteana RWD-64-598 SS2]EIW77854.1 hypothetical protein CONPUDRAFT_157032 [Coniophora puteana RWD-64-598 SS2]